jgi:peptidoglycan/xylan/chitin deacetylase (PgdA/CDA1 family)
LSDLLSPSVLMYHGILGPLPTIPPNRGTGAELYYITLDNFKAQMKWLKDNGYAPTLFDNTKNLLEPKPVIITFDDGEMNNFQDALPVLNKFGWKAYFFIIIKRIGEEGYMGWKELKELHKAGMVIGSHGLTHEILTNLLDSQMEEELRASKQNLERNLGIAIDTISIPRGFCNDKIIETAYRLGYKTIFISERPAGLKSGCLSRIAVKSNWSLNRFDLALKGKTPLAEQGGDVIKKTLKTLLRESGYNWVRNVLIKLMR